MTKDSLEKGLELEAQIGAYDIQVRKLNEAIAFTETHGEKAHYHLQALPFGLQTPNNQLASWCLEPEDLLGMMRPRLAKVLAERAATQAEFDAL
jgi:uncharacterized coiled-coil protein SlyX